MKLNTLRATRLHLFVALVCMQLGCVSVTTTPETVKTMSSEFLCEMLGPGWIGTKEEHEVIRDELLERDMVCDFGRLSAANQIEAAAQGRTLSDDTSRAASGVGARYECYTYDYPAQHILTLPVAPLEADVAEVTVLFHGENLTATYLRNGLTQLWLFEENLYVQIDPDLTGKYMDFQGAEEGEQRKPKAVFECKKRG